MSVRACVRVRAGLCTGVWVRLSLSALCVSVCLCVSVSLYRFLCPSALVCAHAHARVPDCKGFQFFFGMTWGNFKSFRTHAIEAFAVNMRGDNGSRHR